jgi:hypothetical protein
MNTPNEQTPDVEIEEADLEQLAKADKPVPKARRYRIRVDDGHYTTEKPRMTGREILVLAGKNPSESFILTQKLRGGRLVTIGLDDVVDFTKPGIERFTTLPREVQEG